MKRTVLIGVIYKRYLHGPDELLTRERKLFETGPVSYMFPNISIFGYAAEDFTEGLHLRKKEGL